MEQDAKSSILGKLSDDNLYLDEGPSAAPFVGTSDGKGGLWIKPNPNTAFDKLLLKGTFPNLTEAQFNAGNAEPVHVIKSPSGRWMVDRAASPPPVEPTATKGVPLKPLAPLAIGRESRVSTERGTEVSTKYAIVEAPDLVTSHDTMLNRNADFPAELQPRERDRAASADQINRIAQNVRPEYLGESPKASEGAPIVGSDGVVESGNGRVLGLRKAFEAGKADTYRQYLLDNAEAFGLDKAAIENAREPVLVRVRQSSVDRPQFVREANEAGVASMSAPEQARSDAQRLTGSLLTTFTPSESGEINTAANTPFIQAFMRDVVGPNELGRYVSAKGEISQEGLTRIRNAIFARAYGDSPEGIRALEKIAESPDNNVRNITTALLQRAGQFASLKEGIAKGERYALDPTSDLTKALAKLSTLREQETTVADYLNQRGLFGDDLTPMQKQMLWAFDEFKRSTKTISSILDNYAKGAEAAGSPKQTAFFEKSPPTKEALLEAAIREMVRDANKEISLFEAEGVRPESEAGRSVPNIDQASQPVSEGVPEPDTSVAGGSAAAPTESPAVLRASLAPGVPEFIQQDVLPTAKSFGAGVVETLKGAAQFLSPRSFAPKEGVDILMKMKGNRDKAEFLFQKSMEEVKANFERMPQADLIQFMDRYKRGMPQATPELQAVADSYKVLNDEMYAELKKWKPSLPYLEDHFRVFWKVIPGAPEAKGFSGMFRRPLQGTRGMLKQHTLADVSEGIARGGVPVSYNPQVLQELGYADSMKFITAQRMWQEGKDVGLVKFFKNSERGKIPDDYTQIKDPIAKVYFPTEGGLSSPGEWYAQEDFARLINNHLSRDYIREAALGRGAMWLKNQMTMVELGLSGFHAVFETNEAVASQLGQGMRRIWNLGVLQGQPEQIAKGLSDIIAAPISPAGTARAGGSAIEYLTNKEEFLKTTRGQSFIKQFPEASQMLDDLFTGGGQIGMSEAYRTNTTRAFNEAIANGNYPGALLRALPAFNEQVMKPLFQVYIPRLKVGQFLKEYQLMLQEYKPDLESGRLTRPELARKTWDFVEDRYGEMNFDNLFWDRTFKTSAQLLFRSVTWQLGNLRASFGALPEQAAEIGRSVRNGQVPRLTPKMSWFAGQALVTATLGAIITKAFTGNWPEKLSDYVYPRTDKDDPSQRLSIPTYIRVLTGLVKKPTEAIPNAASSEISRSMEIWRNRDYYGTQVWSPDDPLYKKAPEIIGHFIPVPFSISSFLKSTEQGQPIWKSAASFAGFTKAPAYAYQTPAQERIAELLQRKYGSDVKTERQADRSTLIRDIRVALREKNSDRASELIRQGQASGQLTISDVMGITKASGQSPLRLSFESLAKEVDSYEGLNTMLDVYENYMNEDERKEVRPVLVKKQLALIGLNSVGRGMKPTELRATPAEQQALRERLNKALGVRSVPPPPQ